MSLWWCDSIEILVVEEKIKNWQDIRMCYNSGDVEHTRNTCPKLDDNISQFFKSTHVAYAAEGQIPSYSRSAFMSYEEFKKYQMLQQFQAVQTSSSSATLVESGNLAMCFTSRCPNMEIINIGPSVVTWRETKMYCMIFLHNYVFL